MSIFVGSEGTFSPFSSLDALVVRVPGSEAEGHVDFGHRSASN
jgi:hypothetical protein